MNLVSRISYRIQSFIFRSILSLVVNIPYHRAINIGRFIGKVAWIGIPLHRKISEVQMRHTLNLGNEKEMTRTVLMYQGDSIIDMIRFAFISDEELKERILIEGREHIEKAVASGRGVMMITGHMNQEILGHIPRLLGFEFCIMGDIMKNRALQELIEDLRSRCGFTLLPPKGGMMNMLTAELKKGRVMGIIMDQRGKRDNRVFCDFLGLSAPLNPAPAFIALKGDALVQPVSAIKKGDNYVFKFEPFLDTRDFGTDYQAIEKISDSWQSQAVQELSCAMHKWLEGVVRETPEQWFWMHTKWLRRSDMKKVINKGADFRAMIQAQKETFVGKEPARQG